MRVAGRPAFTGAPSIMPAALLRHDAGAGVTMSRSLPEPSRYGADAGSGNGRAGVELEYTLCAEHRPSEGPLDAMAIDARLGAFLARSLA